MQEAQLDVMKTLSATLRVWLKQQRQPSSGWRCCLSCRGWR